MTEVPEFGSDHWMGNMRIRGYDMDMDVRQITCVCACNVRPIGRGDSLTECATDLQAKFDAHVEATR